MSAVARVCVVVALATFATFATFAACAGGRPRRDPPSVVFVCQKGSVKSVIAATHFAARARARGMSVDVRARAVMPVAELAPATIAGLAADGLTPIERIPVQVTPDDLAHATRTIAFEPLPSSLAQASRRIDIWDVPPVSNGYEAARDEMVRRSDQLLDELARESSTVKGAAARP
jgi:protein-tyrosine-phosphatase